MAMNIVKPWCICLSDATHGDRKHCRGEIDYERLYELVRLADTMASVQSLEEGTRGLKNRLKDLARRLKHLQFYYHKITDYRGLTTNLYHQAIAQTLQTQYNLYPLLFFANGTLYLSEGELQDFNRDEFINSVVQSFNNSLQQLGEKPGNQPEYNRKTQRFENYVFTFWTAAQLLEFLKANSQEKVKPGWFQEYLQKRFNSYFKDAFGDQEKFQELFHLDPTRDRDPNFAEKWAAVNRYLGGVLNLLRDVYLSPDESWAKVIPWLCQPLHLSPCLQTSLTESAFIFNRAGTPEFSQIMAYHYLEQFNLNGDSVLVTPVEIILDTLNQQLSPSIITLDSPTKRLNYVEDELALQEDTLKFIEQSLILSWSIDSDKLIDDPLPIVTAKKKTGSPKGICSLCNRVIPKGMKAATIKKDILEDSLKEFSNRLTPKRNVTSRLWCPQCYLEWTVRKLAGLGYAPGADTNKSERLYFFILPNPLLTPELLDVLADKHGKRNAGDRIISFGIFDDEDGDNLDLDSEDDTNNSAKLPSNFLLVTLEASAYKSGESIKATELWMRGLLTALVLQDLFGMQESTIAQRLTEVNRNELAGARFFADYHRHETHNVPDVFRQACCLLLESFETVEVNIKRMSLKNLAETIASQSLDLFLPKTPNDGKGKANRYETIYRTAIAELKKVSRQPDLETEELIGHIAGTLIKRLERLDTGISFPFVFKDEDKNKRARQFAQTIVVDLFEQRCHRSFSRLSRYENDLANGVFFYVSEQISAKWAQWNQQKQQRKVKSDVGATR
ncbi:type I-D CRISPR-associated protein Cas10d/Csc3 [Coleofasciculus sp. F4-SAH-05]|uniref:type I-D CRISPR-associated protein Cas10d/Csc3 n=1 Tax=Coleofasciculus sp. F4-SAH-05 TaxID=3069525 RepID=UPI0032FAB408